MQEISIEERDSPLNITFILMDIYSESSMWARKNNQVIGEKNDYYITLKQLMEFLKLRIKNE